MKSLYATLSPLALAAFVAVPAQAQQSIYDTAVANGNFTTLVAALDATGLDAALDGPGEFTAFAPTDAAFAALPPRTIPYLLGNLDELTSVLLYHVIGDDLLATDVLAVPYLTTLNPQRVDISVMGGLPFVDDAQIVITDIICTNGVIHVIDAVLTPNRDNTLRTASNAGVFGTLVGAVSAFPSLVAALTDEGGPEFTVFAPADSAFAALPPWRLQAIVNNPALLAEVLTLHVVPGRLYADQIIAAGSVTTLQGEVLPVTTSGGEVFIGGVRIVAPDLETSNGNIHVVEEVLLF